MPHRGQAGQKRGPGRPRGPFASICCGLTVQIWEERGKPGITSGITLKKVDKPTHIPVISLSPFPASYTHPGTTWGQLLHLVSSICSADHSIPIFPALPSELSPLNSCSSGRTTTTYSHSSVTSPHIVPWLYISPFPQSLRSYTKLRIKESEQEIFQ